MVRVGVITASTADSSYADCVPWFVRFWSLQKSELAEVEFEPLVVFVGEELPTALEAFSDHCVLFPTDIPGPFVAQNIRNYFPAIADFDVIVTSDVDMFPLTSRVIDTALSAVLEDGQNFVVARDVLPTGQFPICYSVGTADAWRALCPARDRSEIQRALELLFANRMAGGRYDGVRGGPGWFVDQEHLYDSAAREAAAGRLNAIGLSDTETGHRRLDRDSHNGLLRWRLLLLVALGKFTDYHAHHPVSKNRLFVLALLGASLLANRIRFDARPLGRLENLGRPLFTNSGKRPNR